MRGTIGIPGAPREAPREAPVHGGPAFPPDPFVTAGVRRALAKKADKVSNATNGNFAGLDSNGNLADSGRKAADFASASHTHTPGSIGAQPAIADLEAIRAGAAAGATAVQPEAGKGLSSNDYTDADKEKLDGIDMSGKADKVVPATSGNLASLDGNGNLADSGLAAGDVADKDFVNSSVATNTATFRGTYNLVSDLGLTTAATREQTAAAVAARLAALSVVPENNDYCFVQVPTADGTPAEISRVDRYKCTVSGSPASTAWGYEWSLNNSSFTAAQWAAINSGITAADKAKLAGIAAGAQVNAIETVKVNGTALTPDGSKAVNVVVPTGTAANKDVPASGNATATQVVMGNDTRLSDARTPTAHKSSHATGGSDALTPGDIGAVSANVAIAGATKCKVTYDSKGLVTGGANLAASDIPTLSTEKLSDFGTEVRYGHYEHVYDSTGTVSLLDRTINDVTLQAVDLSEDWGWGDFEDEAHGQPVWNANAGEWELPSTSDLYGRLDLLIRDTSGRGKYSDGLEVSWTDANQAFTEIDLTYYGDSGIVGAVGPDGSQYGSDYASVDFSNGSINATFTYGYPMRPTMVGVYAYYDSNDNGGVQHKITYSSSSQGTQYIRNASYDDVNNVVEFEFTRDQNWDHDEQAAAMVVGGDGSTYVEFTQPPGAMDSNDLLFGRATLDNGSVSGVTLYVVEYATIYADIYHVEYVGRYVFVDQTVASIDFPVLPSGTTGVRDFLMRLTVGDLSDLSYGYAPIAWPYDVVFETEDGEMPDLSEQGTYLLSFTETKPASGNDPAVFALSCKELTEATQS